MKTYWPAYRLTWLLLVSLAFVASPMSAQTGPPGHEAVLTAPAATKIAQVEVGRAGQETSVRVEGNGRLTYQATRLSNPERLVLDFSGVRLALARTSIPSQAQPVRRVRLSQFKPDVARMVIDLERAVPYQVRPEGQTITVAFAAPETPASIPAPRTTVGLQKPAAQLAKLDVSAMPLPETLTRSTAALASPALPQPQSSGPAAESPAPKAAPVSQQPAGKYSGEPISVNLKDVDLKDFFRLIHEISGLNVVLDPAVKGTLTLVLDDVPWDQALELVLRNNNLDKQLEGNVLRVATKETLKKGIDFGGDSMSDYRNIKGEKGKFQDHHRAYLKHKTKCQKKGCAGVLLKLRIGARSAHFCPIHQKLFI